MASADTAKVSKSKSAPAKKKSPPTHPSFSEMITEAIVSLKERTGSSQIAIQKFIEEKHSKSLPQTYKKLILNSLKRLVASEHLVKVKNSFKLPSARSTSAKPAESKPKAKPAPAAAKPKAKAKPVVAKSKAKAVVKPKVATKPKAKPAAKAVVKPKAKAAPKRKVAKPAAKSTPSKVKKVVPVKKPKSVKKSPAKKKARK